MNDEVSKNMDMLQKIIYSFKSVDKSLAALKFNFKTFLGLIAFPLLLSVFLYVFYYAFIIRALDTSTEAINISPVVWFGLFLLFLLMVISYIIIAPALIATQIASVKKVKITVKEALKQSKKFIFRYVLIGVLIGLSVLLPVIITAILFVLFPPSGLLLFPIFSAWAFIVIVITYLAPYILITKDLSVTETIKASYYISKNNLQWIIAIWVVTFFFPFILTSVFIPFSSNIYVTILSDAIYWLYYVAYSCLTAYIYVKHLNTDLEYAKPKITSNKPKANSTSNAPKALK